MTRDGDNAQIERAGVAHVERVVSDQLGWIFRSIPQIDRGIDGEIEVVEDGRATAQFIKLQIKSGKSYARGTERFTVSLSDAHKEQARRANVPVILIVYDPGEKCAYWRDLRTPHDDARGIPFVRAETRFDRTAQGQLRALVKPPSPSMVGGSPRLPAPPRCMGREREIEDLVAALLGEPFKPIPILGGPGMGKSCLAAWAMHDRRVAQRFGSRRFFVRCDGAQNGEELLSVLARWLGMPPGTPPGPWLQGELQRAPALLVLDNLETPWESDPEGTSEVLQQLASIQGLAWVVTLRGKERPPHIDWHPSIQSGPLPLEDARRLFLAMAPECRPTDPDLEPLLIALDGMPLAVELLGRRTDGDSRLRPLREAWDHQGTMLLEDGRGDRRSNSLRVSIEMSIQSQRMTPEALRLLSMLAWLPDGVDQSQATQLLAALENDTVVPLKKTGLAFEEGGRLRTLAPIRKHVSHWHPPTPEDQDRLYRHFFTLALTHGPTVGKLGGADAAAALNWEAGNLDALIKRGLASKEPALAIEAAIALKSWLRYSGLGTLELLRQAEQIAQKLRDPQAEAKAIQAQAEVALARSQYNEAETAYGRSLKLHRALADRPGEVDALLGLGHIERYRSESRQSQKRYEEALALASELGHRELIAHAKKSLGHAALALKQVAMAQRHYEEALGEFTELGDTCEMANCHRSLGLALIDGQALDEGKQLLHDAQDTFEQVGDLRGAADCHRALGCLAIRRQQLEKAEGCYRQALEHYRRIKDRRGEALCLLNLGRLLKGTSESDARQALYEALKLFGNIPSYRSIGRAHELLARLALSEDARREHAEKAQEAWSRLERGTSATG